MIMTVCIHSRLHPIRHRGRANVRRLASLELLTEDPLPFLIVHAFGTRYGNDAGI